MCNLGESVTKVQLHWVEEGTDRIRITGFRHPSHAPGRKGITTDKPNNQVNKIILRRPNI